MNKLFRPFVLLPLLVGCVTNISYFPDQRGPFVCRVTDAPSKLWPDTQEFTPVPLANWPKYFALRNSTTNEIVVLANELKVKRAFANPTYSSQFGRRQISAIKILMIVGLESTSTEKLKGELLLRYPGAEISESAPAEIVVDLYSMWLGSEYIRTPCDGIGLDDLPFEVTLPALDGERFLKAPPESLQFAGSVMYRDAKTGWRLHRSFTLNRSEFIVSAY